MATQYCIPRMTFSESYTPSIYRENDNMLVRVNSGNRVLQRHFAMLHSPSPTQKWFSVSDVTSVARLQERQRPRSQPQKVEQMHLIP